MSLILIAIFVFGATLLGGMFALRFHDRLHFILGFSAGAVLGVAFLDLLPESYMLSSGLPFSPTILTLAGIIFYMIIDRVLIKHGHGHEHTNSLDGIHEHESRGVMRALALSIHSFIDGIAIGLSFHISAALGIVVTIAVLAHDFSDGINTVGSILKSGQSKKKAFRWLLIDAIAPVIGIFSTYLFTLSEQALGILLSIFAGFFVYIGASDLVPESFHRHPTRWTTFATVLGALVVGIAIYIAG